MRYFPYLIFCLLFCSCFVQKPYEIQIGKKTESQLIIDLKFLSSDDLKGRKVGEKESIEAAEYIQKRFQELTLEKFNNDFTQEFQFKHEGEIITGRNVVGKIIGSSKQDKVIVITAHFDHLGIINGQIYNGADDNASGTAALMALAAYFSKTLPKHTLMFAAVDAEELGSEGAQYLLQSDLVSVNSIVLNVNLDMISRNENNELYASGTNHNSFLKSIIEKVPTGNLINLKFGHDGNDGDIEEDWTGSSDHRVFFKADIPHVYFGVEDHEDYHKHTDDFENIDIEFFIEVVNFLKSTIQELDKSL